MGVSTMRGKELALQALSGKATERIPRGLFTWEFDYHWKAAGIEPWQLACGGSDTWHKAHMGLYKRHQPELLWYNGSGKGVEEPTLLEDTEDQWLIKDGNSGIVYELTKTSLTLRNKNNGTKSCDSVGRIETKSDVKRLIPEFEGYNSVYLDGLRKLIKDIGTDALILPHHSPGYICACYAFGFERAMETMLTDPALFTHVCDKYADGDNLRMYELAESGAEAVFIADGWASCDIISPEMFDRFALPYQLHITEAAKQAGLKVILWNEGDILKILDREVQLPIDAFAFEQPRKGIELTVKKVRESFGRKRCLFGNFDSEHLLMRNNTAEIKAAAVNQIEQSGRDCPFVFCTGSPIPDNIEEAAVDKMLDAAKGFRWK